MERTKVALSALLAVAMDWPSQKVTRWQERRGPLVVATTRPDALCRHSPQGNQGETLLVWRDETNNTCVVKMGYTFEDRARLTGEQIVEATADLGPFSYLRIGIGDSACDDVDLAYAVPHENCRAKPIPDYIFSAWPSVGMSSFDAMANELRRTAQESLAQHRLCGWAGTPSTSPARGAAISIMRRHPSLFSVHEVKPLKVTDPHRRMTWADQVRNWSCLVDLVGRGYSGRVPLLLHTGRPLLYIIRGVRTFYDSPPHHIKPYEHFVPVRQDLSNLEAQARWVLAHPDDAARIGHAGQIHAQRYLTRGAAIAALRATIENTVAALPLGTRAADMTVATRHSGASAAASQLAASSSRSYRAAPTSTAKSRPINARAARAGATTRPNLGSVFKAVVATPLGAIPTHDHSVGVATGVGHREPCDLASSRTIAGRRRCRAVGGVGNATA